jgi:glutamate/tyrosine decarboxylase-like PLP-dependent enzyme
MTNAYDDLLMRAAREAARFRATVGDRSVTPSADRAKLRAAFDTPLPQARTAPDQVIDELIAATADGLMGTAGPRFFGFVIGGSLPAATAADVLTAGWDQCAYNDVLSPAAAACERAAGGWLKDLLGLPASASVGFVTGAQAANTVGLTAGRHSVLADAGWDVESDGLIGAPRVRVVAGAERHATIDRATRLVGLGTSALEPVAANAQGAIDVDDLRTVLARGPKAPTIVCLQAGNVNTGACDDFSTAIAIAREHGAWVHVDGAFGLWAGASPRTARLVDGVAGADSWGTDAHKWLNVPYDSGLAFCAHPEIHATSMSYTASYLVGSGTTSDFVAGDLTPESSRRARGFPVWAALRELGRDGVADLVDRLCVLARRFADRLVERGATVHNDIVLNQVLVSLGDPSRTDAIIEAIQQDGTCWLGGTTWRGQRLIRISVSNWSTTEDDIDRSADAILRIHRSM